MNCPVCRKPLKFQRFPPNSPELPFRLNKKQFWVDGKWHSDLRVECEETVIFNGQKIPHFYKDYRNAWGCSVWVIIYPYRIQQHPIATWIQKWVGHDKIPYTKGQYWQDCYRSPDRAMKISIEEAIELCWQYEHPDA